jgi:hypothetical protein
MTNVDPIRTFTNTPIGELGTRGSLILQGAEVLAPDAFYLAMSSLNELFSLLNALNYPESRLSRSVQGWWIQVANEPAKEGRRVFVEALPVRRYGQLACYPNVEFVLVRSSNTVAIEPSLNFVLEGTPSRRQFKIVLQLHGADAPERELLNANLRDNAVRTIYIPEASAAAIDARWPWMEDVRFLLLLYLFQQDMISLDREEGVRDFLRRYLEKFHAVRKVGWGLVLAYLRSKFRFQMDYRGLKKYVSLVAKGLSKGVSYEARTSPVLGGTKAAYSVVSAARELDLAPRTLYEQISKGKIKVSRRSLRYDGALLIAHEELQRLKKQRSAVLLRKAVIQAYASNRQISINSARRWLETQEAKGRLLHDIVEQLEISKTLASHNQRERPCDDEPTDQPQDLRSNWLHSRPEHHRRRGAR